MTSEKKMIMITSDQHLIEQFQFTNNANTQIFTFDKGFEENNDFMNLTFAQFFQTISSTDQLCKRQLDLSDDNSPSKQIKLSKDSNSLICTICGDRAIGFNYDAMSCASCKSFFRRNAFQDLNQLRCLRETNQCSVEKNIRRKCTKCRLTRCLTMGMKKSFLLNDEERNRRKYRSNQTTSNTTDNSLIIDLEIRNEKSFSDNDLIFIEKISSLFLSIFPIETDQFNLSLNYSTPRSALLDWSLFANELCLRTINLFRQIEQFEQLNVDDRFILIKYNLFSIYPLSKSYYFNKHIQTFDDEVEQHRKFFRLCQTTTPTINSEKFIHLLVSLIQITEQNPKIVSLLFLILLFTPGLSLNENEPVLKDSLVIHRTQMFYTKLLWNYLISTWGDIQGQLKFLQLFRMILRIQLGTKRYRDFFRHQYQSLDVIQQIQPLFQSVLHFS